MKKYIGFFIGLLLMAGLTGCLNKTCPQHDEIYIDNYAKSLFFSFPTGSYWIYQDSLGNTDSIWVSYTSDGILANSGCDEQCIWDLSSSIPDNSFTIRGTAGTPSEVGISVGEVYFLNGTVDSTYNNPLPYGPYTYISYTPLSNYVVNQYVFPNALKIKSNQSLYVYIIVVPNIGIVEMSGQYGPSYKLIKYSIK